MNVLPLHVLFVSDVIMVLRRFRLLVIRAGWLLYVYWLIKLIFDWLIFDRLIFDWLIQLTYASNVAQQLVDVMNRNDQGGIDGEVFFVADHTPVLVSVDWLISIDWCSNRQGPYQLMDKLIPSTGTPKRINFYIFYVIYCMFAVIIRLLLYVGVETKFGDIPTPGYMRAMLHDWNFVDGVLIFTAIFIDWRIYWNISDEKRRLLDIKPIHSFEKAIERSQEYYCAELKK